LRRRPPDDHLLVMRPIPGDHETVKVDLIHGPVQVDQRLDHTLGMIALVRAFVLEPDHRADGSTSEGRPVLPRVAGYLDVTEAVALHFLAATGPGRGADDPRRDGGR